MKLDRAKAFWASKPLEQAVNQKSRAVRFGLEILWPACAVVVGLLATLAWIALLGWGLYRAVLMLGFV
jgi:ABC-type phosphate transport system permease subunit